MNQCLCSLLHYLLLAIGIVALLRGLCAFFTFLRVAFTRLNQSWANTYGKGSWAIVTGCTEGIGKAFCFELASLGFNLVLVSRNSAKLQNLNKQLWAKYPQLHTVICKADFSEYNHSLYDGIMNKVKDLDLSILVNNVGLAHIKKFDQLSIQNIEQQINVNVNAMTFLSRKIVPFFLQRKKRCAIINLSSQSISYSLRTLSVYTGTKAYNDNFSRCLYQDYQGVIDVLDSVPAIVSTAGTNFTKDPLSCTAEQCAQWSLKALGKTDYTAGHWTHTVQSWLTMVAGETITRWVANKKLRDVDDFKTA